MLIIVPTRGRPANVERLQANLAETMTTSSRVLFAVDADDPALGEYLDVTGNILVGDRLRLGGTLNKIALDHVDEYDVIGFMGDDVRPGMVGWDEEVLFAMRPNGLVYCNDGIHGAALPTAVFMNSDVIKRLGYMVLPGMTHLFIDNYWWELGRRLGTMTYLEHVLLEHLHPLVGKGEHDQTYADANSDQVWSMDQARLNEHIRSGAIDESVRRILE